MVKVEERTKRERALERKAKELLKITESHFDTTQRVILSDDCNILIFDRSDQIKDKTPLFVSVDDHLISVESYHYFDIAMALAKKYEEYTGRTPEWTVKREYDE